MIKLLKNANVYAPEKLGKKVYPRGAERRSFSCGIQLKGTRAFRGWGPMT